MVVLAPASSFHHQRAAAAAAAADGADQGFALISAAQCGLADPGAPKSGSAIQFWQSHSQPPTTPPAAVPADKKQLVSVVDYGGGGASSGGSAGSTTCNDCGNQAKKDCPHQRCRTCCKSRGFDCTTHVRSTWIPAARRREKQPLGGDLSPPAAPATAATKKPRLLSSQTTTTTTTSTSNGTSSSQQDAPFKDSLPRHVRAPAVFRCVRVTSVDDGADEFAYQAAVSINGHTFRGFLYDQGADSGRANNDEPSQAHAAAVRSISDLHLGSASAVSVSADMYNTVSGALILGGLGYGNTMN